MFICNVGLFNTDSYGGSLLVVLIFGCRSRLLSDDTSDGLTSQVHVLFCAKLSFVCSESMLLFGEDHFYLFLSIFMLVVFLISAADFFYVLF